MQKICKLSLILILSFLSLDASANFIDVTALQRFPGVILTDHQALALYKITNNTPGPIGVIDGTSLSSGHSLASGQSPQTGLSYCTAQQILQTNQSCVLGVQLGPISQATTVTGIIKECIANSIYCFQDPQAVNVTTSHTPTPDMPTLSIPSNIIYLTAGVEEGITVTNTSSRYAANDVKFTPGFGLQDQLAVIDNSNCAYIVPGGTCQLKVTAKENAVGVTPYPAYIQGANTYAISATAHLVSGGVNVNNVTFETPGAQNLVLTNSANLPAQVTNITFAHDASQHEHKVGATIHNVTIGDYSSCSTLAAHGGTCSVPLTTTLNSYGNDQIHVNYNLAGHPSIAEAQISVTNTAVGVAELSDDEYSLHHQLSPQTFTVTNTGNFNWLMPNVDWATTGINGVTIQGNTCTTPLAPGITCQFQLATTTGALPGNPKVIRLSGANLNNYDRYAVVDGFNIMPEIVPSYTHLGYKAIKLENGTDSHTANIIDIIVNIIGDIGSPPRIKYCSPTDSDCAYKTDSDCAAGGELQHNESCHIWFKASPVDTSSLGAVTGQIMVKAIADWTIPHGNHFVIGDPHEEVATFNANYEQYLYVGGDFTTAGGSSAQHIAKWDGSDWSNVGVGGGGMDQTVRALTILNGDLYAGGEFTTADGGGASRVARWNGSSWSALGSGVSGSGNAVYALAGWNDQLYVGGYFSSPHSYLTRWNGSSWSAVGGGVNFVVATLLGFNHDNELYVGGSFSNPSSYLAKWDGNTLSSLGTSPSGTVTCLTNINDEYIYVGGVFNTAGGITVNKIAKWDGINWSALGSGVNVGVNGQASAMTNIAGDLYVGGAFTQAAGTSISANHIARWNAASSTWAALDNGVVNGVDGEVYALAAINSYLYVGGNFTNAGGDSTNYIAGWDEETSSWGSFATGGMNNAVRALLIAPSLVITTLP